MTLFSYAFFPIVNIFSGIIFFKSLITIKIVKTIFFGVAFTSGIIAQQLILNFRRLIVKEIFFHIDNSTSEFEIGVRIVDGRILKDKLKNIKISFRDNDYVTPDYVFTSEDVKKISYFIEINNEEFYIPRRLIKIKDAEAYRHIIEANTNFDNL